MEEENNTLNFFGNLEFEGDENYTWTFPTLNESLNDNNSCTDSFTEENWTEEFQYWEGEEFLSCREEMKKDDVCVEGKERHINKKLSDYASSRKRSGGKFVKRNIV